jgi:beta-1,2-mannobiose phosphorylase / 1,2-beta-oligomannan phosphorylase
MTVPASDHRVLLRPTDLEPLGADRTIVGVFNPAATRFEDDIILLARVDESPMAGGSDTLTLPRIDCVSGEPRWVIDTLPREGADTSDPREFRLADGSMRLPHLAHLRVVRLSPDGTTVLNVSVVRDLLPSEDWEELGIEDPRITLIGDTYYVTYVAISRHMGIATALMTTRDFKSFTRHGIIFTTENKDVVMFPDVREGGFTAYHRPMSCSGVSAPSILSSRSPDGVHWGQHRLLIGPRPGMWDCAKVGAGPPPIRVPEGWLLIYHGVDKASPMSPVGTYRAGALLIDAEDPSRVLARSQEPMIEPHHPHERRGFVPKVVFPTGLVPTEGGDVLVFGGAADEVTTMTRLSLQAVLDHLNVSAT